MGRDERLSEIAREPQGKLLISPDNGSRRELNSLIHREVHERGDVSHDEHKLRVLDSRQQMTGADGQCAGQYEEGAVVRYTRGSKVLGIGFREAYGSKAGALVRGRFPQFAPSVAVDRNGTH